MHSGGKDSSGVICSTRDSGSLKLTKKLSRGYIEQMSQCGPLNHHKQLIFILHTNREPVSKIRQNQHTQWDEGRKSFVYFVSFCPLTFSMIAQIYYNIN